MNTNEIGFVFIFISAFGLSNYFVKHMKLKKTDESLRKNFSYED